MGDRGVSSAVLRGLPWPPSGSAVEVIEGMAVEVVVVGIAVDREDEEMATEVVLVEMVEVVTAEITSC